MEGLGRREKSNCLEMSTLGDRQAVCTQRATVPTWGDLRGPRRVLSPQVLPTSGLSG